MAYGISDSVPIMGIFGIITAPKYILSEELATDFL
jgi:hypothetical protein